MLNEKIKHLNSKLANERIHGTRTEEKEIQLLIREVIESLSVDYNTYHSNVGQLLSCLENNHEVAIVYELQYFMEQIHKLTELKSLKKLDLSILEFNVQDSTLDKFKQAVKMGPQAQPRLSSLPLDTTSLSATEKKELVSSLVDKVQHDAKTYSWVGSLFEDNMYLLMHMRQMLVELGQQELFYFVIELFVERLATSELFQHGRNVVEEVITASYIDQLPHLGFLNAFKLYSVSKNVHGALLYGNLSLSISLSLTAHTDRYVREVIWQSVKFFRNIHLYKLASEVYNSKPKQLEVSEYDRRAFDASYFYCLLMQRPTELPELLLDYLNKEREAIFQHMESEASPWLILLLQVRKAYPNDFAALESYLAILKCAVLEEQMREQRDLIEGDSDNLKRYVRESITKLSQTKYQSDFVYDNSQGLLKSNRLAAYSYENSDVEGMLLSMYLKSDFSSFLNQTEPIESLVPFQIPEFNDESIQALYGNFSEFASSLKLPENTLLSWLIIVEKRFFQFSLFNGAFSFHEVVAWDAKQYKQLLNEGYFYELSFEDTLKDKSGVRVVSPEEHRQQSKAVATVLSFARIDIPQNATALLLIKDMELSSYPSNLFSNSSGVLILDRIPIYNVASTEWLTENISESSITKLSSKSIWIPTDSGDSTISWLYGIMEDSLTEYSFTVDRAARPSAVLTSDLNIVCSHGAPNISQVQILSQKTSLVYNLNSVVGKGKILIFLVCFSGSATSTIFRNETASLANRYLAMGYKAVIAPAWALDITVVKHWFPEFMDGITKGLSIGEAHWNASKKVQSIFPTVAAAGCLHFYGNPFYKFDA